MNKAGRILIFAVAVLIIVLAAVVRQGRLPQNPPHEGQQELEERLEEKLFAGEPLSEADYAVLQIPRKARTLNPEVKEILERSERLTVLSIEPYSISLSNLLPEIPNEEGEVNTPGCKTLRGYEVLGQMELPIGPQRSELLQAMYQGIEQSYRPAACFDPRHGISATLNGKSVELLICYACNQIYVYSGNNPNWTRYDRVVCTPSKPAAVFNRLLTSAGVPLPRQ